MSSILEMDRLVLVIFALLAVTNVYGNHETNSTRTRRYECPRNFVRLSHKCYYFSENEATWQDAYWKCRDLSSNLATIKNPNQDKVVRRTLEKNRLGSVDRWIGGRYDWGTKSWIWAASGRSLQYNGFTTFNEEQKQSLQWHCIILDHAVNYRWNTSNCIESKRFICQTKVQLPSNKKKLEQKHKHQKINKLNETPVVPELNSNYLSGIEEKVLYNNQDNNIYNDNLKSVAMASRPENFQREKRRRTKHVSRTAKGSRRQHQVPSTDGVLNDSPPAEVLKSERDKKRYERRMRRMQNRKLNENEKMKYKTFYGEAQSPLHPPVIVEEFTFNH